MPIIESQADQRQTDYLLQLSLPEFRRAYSDRTAWLMSCLSLLAYLRFNELFSGVGRKDYFVAKMTELLEAGSEGKQPDLKQKALLALIDAVGYDPVAEKAALESDLGLLNLSLVETFDNKGTQAILVQMGEFRVLAFRGTEAMSIKDIRADTRASTASCESGGKVHTGFTEAFDNVSGLITRVLNKKEHANAPLYITGHSLGGALATIAAKRLQHPGGIAACYTFGSPRVGDEEWVAGIKAPVYRVVNAADCVTMLPPGANTVTAFGWLVQFVPVVGLNMRKWLLSRFNGYMHGGDMRYLTNVKKGEYATARLLFSVTLYTRLRGLIEKHKPWRSFLCDHSIDVYRRKLAHIATTRNPAQAPHDTTSGPIELEEG